MDWKKVLVNVVVTFFEAGFAVWAAAGFKADNLVIGAVVGAGASAVWNIVFKPLLQKAGFLK